MQCEYFAQCDMKEQPDDEIPDCIFSNGEGLCTIDYDINLSTDLYRKNEDIEKDLQPLPHMGNGYSNTKEPTECTKSICDVPTTEVLLVDRSGLTTGPVKTQIIRCPKCGSSNVYPGIAEKDGIHILCYGCNETSFVEKEKI